MKKNNREILILNDLIKMTGELLNVGSYIILENFPKDYATYYRYGAGLILRQPTYQLHIDNFTAFVERLEELEKQHHGINEKALEMFNSEEFNGQEHKIVFETHRLEKKFKTDFQTFIQDYKEAFEALIFEQKENGRKYFNMQFYPRTKDEQGLFGRFTTAYLNIFLMKRLHIQGWKRKKESPLDKFLPRADEMRRNGKGEKSGSLETITRTWLKKMKVKKGTDEWERLRVSTYKKLCRHFKEIGI